MLSVFFAISSTTSATPELHGFRVIDATTVLEAVEHITFMLEGQGFEIVTVVDFHVAAKSIGVEIRPTTVILATNPSLETPLIRQNPTSALDFPSKFLLYEDEEGTIQLEHSTVGALLDRHDIKLKDAKLQKYGDLLDQFIDSDDGIVLVKSHQSVDETIEALFSRLQDLGLMIFVPNGIDFQEQAFRHGGTRPSRLVIFGTPAVGIPLVENSQSIGLDLPAKFLIFEDEMEQVFIAFNDPRFLARKHNLQRDADPTISLNARLEMIFENSMNLANSIANPS
jgi:uncharacterized protein (DUF302 family)